MKALTVGSVLGGGAIATAKEIAAQAANGGLMRQLIDVLTTENAERADVLLGLAMIGMALGAGAWIGWEVAKWLAGLVSRGGGMSENEEEQLNARRSAKVHGARLKD